MNPLADHAWAYPSMYASISSVGLSMHQQHCRHACRASLGYAFCSTNDIHNTSNAKIDGEIVWDTFVSVGTVDGKPYPVTFKIRSIDQDVRSQIYEMATKNETGFSREDGDQNNLTYAHSSYGTSPVSNMSLPQIPEKSIETGKKADFSLSSAYAKPLNNGVALEDNACA